MDELNFLGMGCLIMIAYVVATIALIAGTLWAVIWVLQQTGVL